MNRPDQPGSGRRRGGLVARLLGGAALALLAAAAPATATTYCVGIERTGCVNAASTAAAFDAAADGDRILLGEVTATAALDDAGRALEVIGAGEHATDLAGGLTLSARRSKVSRATIGALDLAGTAARVRVQGTAVLRAGAFLRAAAAGGIDAADGETRLETVALTGGAGLTIRCSATLRARHVTLAAGAVTTACADSVARVSDSIVWAPFAGPGMLITSHSVYPAVAGHPDGPGDRHEDPGFASGSLHLPPGSPLVDAGSREPLADGEWPDDRDGLPRIADGDGDGSAVRDPGAFERPPAAVPLPAGNLLRDPGAEHGGAWALADGFARERYGAPFASAATGAALGAGDRFFAGGPTGTASSAEQVVDLTWVAPEIDRGGATVSLSGLLGGYGADPDSGSFEARFLDPAGRPMGATLVLATPAAVERANVTILMPRSRTDPIPPLARSVAVTLRAVHERGGYTDAYFDNLGLAVAAPGAPPPPADPDPGAPPARPFAGIRVLTGSATVDRSGAVAIQLACVAGTVGRCSGVLTLAEPLRRRSEPRPRAVTSFSLRSGHKRRVQLQVGRAVRRKVRDRRRIRMALFAAVRDGQGQTRVSTVPFGLEWRRPRRS